MKLRYAALAIVLAVLFTFSAVIQPWQDTGSIKLDVERGVDGEGSVLVNYSISPSPYSDPISIVLIPLENYRTDPIFIFAERDEYTVEEYGRVLGLYDHLRSEMDNLGNKRSVHIVDHIQVAELLNGTPSVLVIISSSQDWTDQIPNMLSWIDRGGLVFGIGKDALPIVASETAGNESIAAPYRIEYEFLNYNAGKGVSTSAASYALDLKYISPTLGMRVDDVEKYGQVIGYRYSRSAELTSAALIHRGNGSIILFSDTIVHPFTTSMEDAVAYDIAIMLVSGLPWESGTLVSYQVEGGMNVKAGSFVAHLPPSALVSCYVFSPVDHQHRSIVKVV